MDVVRVRDGKQFMLKRMPKYPGNEKEIILYLSSPPPSEDPRNNCVEIEDVLNAPNDPNWEIIVMRLMRPFYTPRFDTIGECVDFFLQAFKVILGKSPPFLVLIIYTKGLQFIHSRHVAHR